jgi:hypothetical protein
MVFFFPSGPSGVSLRFPASTARIFATIAICATPAPSAPGRHRSPDYDQNLVGICQVHFVADPDFFHIASYSSTTTQPASGSNSFIAVAVSVVVFPRSFWSSTPSWLMMKDITPELPYSAG